MNQVNENKRDALPMAAERQRARQAGGSDGGTVPARPGEFRQELSELHRRVRGDAAAASETPLQVKEIPSRRRPCPHPSLEWIHGRHRDYLVCDGCQTAIDVKWPDHHPEISRWLNEGGASGF